MSKIGQAWIVLLARIRQALQVTRLVPFDTSTDAGRSKERYRLIALASLSSIAAKVVTSVLGLVSVPLTLRYLGKELFGLWMVISSLVIWMQVTDFGISNGLSNALAEANGKDDVVAARSYITAALMLISGISIIGIVLVVLLSFCLPWGSLLNIHSDSMTQIAGLMFLIIGLIFIINLPLSIVNRIFTAYQLGYVVNVALIISSISALIGLLVAIYFKLSLLWLVLFVSCGPVVANLLSWSVLPKLLPWFRLEWHLVTRAAIQRIAHSSIPLFVFQIGALLVNQMTNVILARWGSLSMVADYNVLLKIYMLIFSVSAGVATPFYPAIREAYERKERAWVNNSIRRSVVIRAGINAILCSGLVLFGDRLIEVWIKQSIGGGFGVVGWTLFFALLIVSGISSTYSEILIYLDYIAAQIPVVFLNATVLLASSILLIPMMGLKGFYLAAILANLYPMLWGMNKIKQIKGKNAFSG